MKISFSGINSFIRLPRDTLLAAYSTLNKVSSFALRLLSNLICSQKSQVKNPLEDRYSRKCEQYNISYDLLKKHHALEFFIDDHFLEKICYFDYQHLLSDDKNEIKLPYTLTEPLEDECLETLEEYMSFYEEAKQKNLSLRIIDASSANLIEDTNISDLSLEQFLDYIENKDISKIILVHPQELLSLDELNEMGVLDEDDDHYSLTSDYEFTQKGFIQKDSITIDGSMIKSLKKNPNPSQKCFLEVLIHKPIAQEKTQKGHASIKLHDRAGNEFSLGFYPEDSELLFVKQEGEILSPDPYVFFSDTVMGTQTLKFEFPSDQSFNKCLRFIESEISKRHNSFSYDSLHTNCAEFAESIVKYAKSDCDAKKMLERSHDSQIYKLFNKTRQFLERQCIAVYEAVVLSNPKNLFQKIILPDYLLNIE